MTSSGNELATIMILNVLLLSINFVLILRSQVYTLQKSLGLIGLKVN